MSGLKGVCPKCGASYYGWALRNPIEPKCDRCGSDLKISENGVHIRSHYSSLTTRTYKTIIQPYLRKNDN